MRYDLIESIIEKGDFKAFSTLQRWNSFYRIHNETLAEHLFWAAFYTGLFLELTLIEKEDNLKVIKFKRDCLRYATNHDFPELFSGDIPFHVKSNPFGVSIKPALKEYEEAAVSDFLNRNSYFSPSLLEASPEVKNFVKIADWFCMVAFCFQEAKLGNGKIFSPINTLCINKMNEKIEEVEKELISFFDEEVEKKVLVLNFNSIK